VIGRVDVIGHHQQDPESAVIGVEHGGRLTTVGGARRPSAPHFRQEARSPGPQQEVDPACPSRRPGEQPSETPIDPFDQQPREEDDAANEQQDGTDDPPTAHSEQRTRVPPRPSKLDACHPQLPHPRTLDLFELILRVLPLGVVAVAFELELADSLLEVVAGSSAGRARFDFFRFHSIARWVDPGRIMAQRRSSTRKVSPGCSPIP